MRVLFLTHRLPYPPNRGDRIRSFQLLSHLATAAEVDLLSLVHSDEEEVLASELRTLAARTEVVRVPRLRTLLKAAASLPGTVPLTHVLLDGPAIGPALERLVRPTPPDVVLAYCSGMARLAVSAPLDRVPLVLDMVDVDSAKWQSLSQTARGPMRWIYAREARLLSAFERTVTARAKTTFVVNERERASMLTVNPSAHVSVLSNGIDVERFRPHAPEGRTPDVVFCGVFNYEPNVQAALWLADEVWPLVREVRPDATLSLVGMDPTRAIRALATRDGIRVTGTVPDVRPYLWRATLSVAPLMVARGLQNKVLEAVAADLPCVITPQVADGLPPAVLAACRVASSARAFADGILGLLGATADHRAAMVRGAGLEQLTWATQLKTVIRILDEARRSSAAVGQS